MKRDETETLRPSYVRACCCPVKSGNVALLILLYLVDVVVQLTKAFVVFGPHKNRRHYIHCTHMVSASILSASLREFLLFAFEDLFIKKICFI